MRGSPELRVLGPIEALLDGQPVDLGGPQQRAVLTRLLVARGEVVSVDRIIDDLWHGQPPPRATGSLQAYVSNLRRALEPGRAPRTPARILTSTPPGYAVPLTAAPTDATRFERTLREADAATDPTVRADLLRTALGMWRGRAFIEFSAEPWAEAEAARLDELRLTAREHLVHALLSSGRADEATVDADALTRDAPLREEAWRLLALGQYLAGRQAEALATLRRAKAMLAEELGVDPDPRLAELELAILNHRVVTDDARPTASPVQPAAPSSVRPDTTFLGRANELRRVAEYAAAVRSGGPGVVVVSGDAGMGKSALLDRIQGDLMSDGWRVISGRCPEIDGGPPAWAIADAFRSLARDVSPGRWEKTLQPLLADGAGLGDATGATGAAGRFLLHRAACEWLATAADRPLALHLDDVHRADWETVRLLQAVIDYRPDIRLMLVLAHRPESSPPLDELLGLVAQLAPLRISLGGLTSEETNALLTVTAGFPVSEPALQRVLARTDGNPFFVAELGRLIASENERTALAEVPHGVVDVVRRRVARLPDQTITILRLASVIGRVVDVDVLVRASGLDEEPVLTALEAGAIDRLIVDDTPGRVRFTHVLVRDAIHSELPAVRRRAWHAAAADALRALDPDDVSAIAYHAAEAATPTTAADAARSCVAAAEQAEGRYAYDAAVELYERARGCLELAKAPAREQADVAFGEVSALALAGRVEDLSTVRRTVIDLARSTGDRTYVARAVVAGTVPSAWHDRKYLDVDAELIAEVDRCIAEGGHEPTLQCLLFITRARESAFSDDPKCGPSADAAVTLARQLNDPELLALALVAQSEAYPLTSDAATFERIVAELRSLADGHDLHTYRLVVITKELALNMYRNNAEPCDALLAEMIDLAGKLQLPRISTTAMLQRAGLLHLHGNLDAACAAYAEALADYKRLSPRDGVTMELVSTAMVALSRGSGIETTADQLQFMFDYNPPWSYILGGIVACAFLARGDRELAQRDLQLFPDLVEDQLTSVWLAFAAVAWSELGDAEPCRDVYQRLERFAGIVPGITNGFPMLPVDLVLARLACCLNEPQRARAHLEDARWIATAWGNEPWLRQIDDAAAALEPGAGPAAPSNT